MVFSSDSESLSDPCAISCGSPIASSTCDGSSEPDVHAEPEEPAIPLKSSSSSSPSPSMNRKQRFALPGSRFVGWPFSRV